MNNMPEKAIFFLFAIGLTGCAKYELPIQIEDHPAFSNAKISQIELTPLLDIPVSHLVEEEDGNVHFQD